MNYRFRNDSRSGIQIQLHFTNFLIDIFHKHQDEINYFMFIHLLRMKISDQKRDVVTLAKLGNHQT